MGDQSLPGLRFYPTEEELVSFYLHNKLEASSTVQSETNEVINRVIPELLIYEFNPWDLPEVSGELCRGDPEQWFFFIPRQERGGRANRLTSSGYWKATGSPSYVYSSDNYRTIGLKRTMVYYIGRAPSGTKTPWKMNEYKAIIQSPTPAAPTLNIPMLRQEYSLCRVYKQPKTMRAFDRRPIINYPTLPLTTPPLIQQGGNDDGTVEATGTTSSCQDDHARPVIPFLSFDDSSTFIRDDQHVPTPLNYHHVAHFDEEDGSCSMMDWDQLVL